MRVAVSLVLLVAAAGLAAAQSPAASLRGTLTATDGRPLDGATIEVLGTKVRFTTASGGVYRLDGVPAGRHWILIRRIGYAPVRLTATLGAGEVRVLPVSLEPLPTRLAELTVLAEGGMSRHRYQDFDTRSHSAFGKFLTRDDISRVPGDLIDIVQRHLPGRTRFTLEQRYGAAGDLLTMGRLVRRGGYYVADDGTWLPTGRSVGTTFHPDCTPAISVNGSTPWPGISLADFDREQVEALEVYRRGSWVPTEFAYRESLGCGLVVVWLR